MKYCNDHYLKYHFPSQNLDIPVPSDYQPCLLFFWHSVQRVLQDRSCYRLVLTVVNQHFVFSSFNKFYERNIAMIITLLLLLCFFLFWHSVQRVLQDRLSYSLWLTEVEQHFHFSSFNKFHRQNITRIIIIHSKIRVPLYNYVIEPYVDKYHATQIYTRIYVYIEVKKRVLHTSCAGVEVGVG